MFQGDFGEQALKSRAPLNRTSANSQILIDDLDPLARPTQGRCAIDESILRVVLRYVERKPLRAGLVQRAEQWPWSSLPVSLRPPQLPWLDEGPAPGHAEWAEYVATPHSESELAALRHSTNRGTPPYGSRAWVTHTAEALGLESTLRPPRRPRQFGSAENAAGLLPVLEEP
jgi:hypothetical protein